MLPRDNKKLTLRAVLLTLTIVAGYAGSAIAFEYAVPGVKLGLSNAVVLTGLYLLSFWDAFAIVFFKCAANSFLFGSPGAFVFSVCGSLLSLFGMFFFMKMMKRKISPVGVSVVGAVLHNVGQIAAASLILGTVKIAYYLPVLLVSGVAAGFATGVVVRYTLRVIHFR